MPEHDSGAKADPVQIDAPPVPRQPSESHAVDLSGLEASVDRACDEIDLLRTQRDELLALAREVAELSDDTIDESDPALLGSLRDDARALIAALGRG